MATIKIYESDGSGNSIEVFNANEIDDGIIAIDIDISDRIITGFQINRSDAVELINYLIEQFDVSSRELIK